MVPSESFGQCRGGGASVGTASGNATVSSGGSNRVVASGQLLTSPGSLYYDVMMQQQMQQAILAPCRCWRMAGWPASSLTGI